MQQIDRPEKDMTKSERVQLEMKRTLAVKVMGINLRDPNKPYNFSSTSNGTLTKIVDALISRFDISFKDPADENRFWVPAEDLKYLSDSLPKSNEVVEELVDDDVTDDSIQDEPEEEDLEELESDDIEEDVEVESSEDVEVEEMIENDTV
jgi:hypothetical protein